MSYLHRNVSSSVLYWLLMSPPNSWVGTLPPHPSTHPQHDCIWRRGLWGSKWSSMMSYGWGPDLTGLVSLSEKTPDCSLSPPIILGHSKKEAICKPGRELSPWNESAGTLILNVPAFRTARKLFSILYPLSLWWPEQTMTSSLRLLNELHLPA